MTRLVAVWACLGSPGPSFLHLWGRPRTILSCRCLVLLPRVQGHESQALRCCAGVCYNNPSRVTCLCITPTTSVSLSKSHNVRFSHEPFGVLSAERINRRPPCSRPSVLKVLRCEFPSVFYNISNLTVGHRMSSNQLVKCSSTSYRLKTKLSIEN